MVDAVSTLLSFGQGDHDHRTVNWIARKQDWMTVLRVNGSRQLGMSSWKRSCCAFAVHPSLAAISVCFLPSDVVADEVNQLSLRSW